MARLSSGRISNIPVSTERKRTAPQDDYLFSDRKRARTSLRSGLLAKRVNETTASSTPKRKSSELGPYSTPSRAPPQPGSTPIPESARKPTTVLPRPVPEPDSDAEDVLLLHGPSSVTRSSAKKRRSSTVYGSARKAHVRINYTPRSNSSRKQSATRSRSGEHIEHPEGEDTFAFTKSGQAVRARQTSPSPAGREEPEELFFDASQDMEGGDFELGQDSFATSKSSEKSAAYDQTLAVDDVSFGWPANETATSSNLGSDSQADDTVVFTSTRTLDRPLELPSHSNLQQGASLASFVYQETAQSSPSAGTALADPDTSDKSLTINLGDLAQNQADQSRLMDISLPQNSLIQDETMQPLHTFGDDQLNDQSEKEEIAQLLSSPAQQPPENTSIAPDALEDESELSELSDQTEAPHNLDVVDDLYDHGQSSSSPLRSIDGSPTLKPAAFQLQVDPPHSSSPQKASSLFSDEPQLSTIDQLREALRVSRESQSPAPPGRTLQPSPLLNSSSSTSPIQHKLGSPLEDHASSARELFTPSPKGSPEHGRKIASTHAENPVAEPQKLPSPPQEVLQKPPSPSLVQEAAISPQSAHMTTIDGPAERVILPALTEELKPASRPSDSKPSISQQAQLPSSPPQTSSDPVDGTDANNAALRYRVEELSSPRGNIQVTKAHETRPALAMSPMQLVSQLQTIHSRSQSPLLQKDQQQPQMPKESMPPPPLPLLSKSPSKSPRKSASFQGSPGQKYSFAFPPTSSSIGSMPDMPSLYGFLGSPAKIMSAAREDHRELNASGKILDNQTNSNASASQSNILPSDSTSPMSSPVRNLQWRRSVSGSHSSSRDKANSPSTARSGHSPASANHSETARQHGGIRSLADISADADQENGSDDELMSVVSNMSPVRPSDIPRSTKKLIEELTSSPSAGLMSSPVSDLLHHSPAKPPGSPLKRAIQNAEQEAQVEEAAQSGGEEVSVQAQSEIQSPFQHDASIANDTFERLHRGAVASRTQAFAHGGLPVLAEEPATSSSFSGHGDTTVMPFAQGNAAVANSVLSHSSHTSQPLRRSSHRRSLSGSTIEIRSADPEIAAKVAAILTQQHDYHVNKDDTPATIAEKHRLREKRLQELLRKAEQEVSSQVDEQSRFGGSPVQYRSPAQPRVGVANLEVPTSRHVMRQHAWSKSDWRHLEICLKRLQRQAYEAGDTEPRPDPEDVIRQFLDQLALTEDALQGHWSKQKLLYRVEALLEHRCHPKSKSFLVASRHDRAASTGMSSRASSVGFSAYDAHEKRKDAQSGRGILGNLGSMFGL